MEILPPFEIDYEISEIVKDFLKNKVFKRKYKITFIDPEDECKYVTYSDFSDEEISHLKQLKEKYGMENIHSHFDEVFDDPDIISDTFICPDGVTNIDLEHPIPYMRLTVNKYESGSLCSYYTSISIHPNDYKNLMALRAKDAGMNFNKLRHAHQGIYERLLRKIDNRLSTEGYYGEDCPYLVVLTELEEDIVKLLEEHPEIKPTNGHAYWQA